MNLPSMKTMAPHSSTLAWKIPWMEEPGGLQSMGSLRVGHYRATSHSLFTFHFHALEKEMATHSSVLVWRIPGTGEPGGLLSMGSHRVRHNWSDLAAVAAACNAGDEGSLPGLGRSPREGNGNLSSILAWEIPWTEESGSLQSMGSQELDMTWGLNHYQYHTIYLSNYPSNMQTCHIRGRPPLSCCFTFLACILIGENTVCHDHLK